MGIWDGRSAVLDRELAQEAVRIVTDLHALLTRRAAAAWLS